MLRIAWRLVVSVMLRVTAATTATVTATTAERVKRILTMGW
jgi:hypothetical protein